MDRGRSAGAAVKARGSRSDRALSIVFRGFWSIPSEHLGEARQLRMECRKFGRISNNVLVNRSRKFVRVVLIIF